jgi:hypothetical protein
MFIHVREPEEIERFKKDFNCHTLLIKNKNIAQIISNMADSNVEKYEYDFNINNDEGLAELWEKAREFVNNLFEEK